MYIYFFLQLKRLYQMLSEIVKEENGPRMFLGQNDDGAGSPAPFRYSMAEKRSCCNLQPARPWFMVETLHCYIYIYIFLRLTFSPSL